MVAEDSRRRGRSEKGAARTLASSLKERKITPTKQTPTSPKKSRKRKTQPRTVVVETDVIDKHQEVKEPPKKVPATETPNAKKSAKAKPAVAGASTTISCALDEKNMIHTPPLQEFHQDWTAFQEYLVAYQHKNKSKCVVKFSANVSRRNEQLKKSHAGKQGKFVRLIPQNFVTWKRTYFCANGLNRDNSTDGAQEKSGSSSCPFTFSAELVFDEAKDVWKVKIKNQKTSHNHPLSNPSTVATASSTASTVPSKTTTTKPPAKKSTAVKPSATPTKRTGSNIALASATKVDPVLPLPVFTSSAALPSIPTASIPPVAGLNGTFVPPPPLPIVPPVAPVPLIRPFGRRDLLIVDFVPVDIQAAVAFASDPMTSSVTSYVGTTSGFLNDKEIACVVYEADISKAQLELSKLSQTIRAKYPTVVGLAMIVRLGMVKAKEANLVVAVSAPVHAEAMEACTFASQALETSVNVWRVTTPYALFPDEETSSSDPKRISTTAKLPRK